MFRVQDKALRQLVFRHITADIKVGWRCGWRACCGSRGGRGASLQLWGPGHCCALPWPAAATQLHTLPRTHTLMVCLQNANKKQRNERLNRAVQNFMYR